MRYLLILLLVTCSQAQVVLQNAVLQNAVLGGTNAVGGGGGATYLVQQDFEGTGYDNSETWTEVGTGANEDYTNVVLAGSQSLRINPSATTVTTTSPAFDLEEVWAYFLFRPVSTSTGQTRSIGAVLNDGGSPASLTVILNSDRTLSILHGGSDATTVGTVSDGQTYHVWVHVEAGSGGAMDIGFSTDGTKPSSGSNYASGTGSSSTPTCTGIMIGVYDSSVTWDYVVDKVRVDDVVIGSNPE